mmetsp:Transcript_28158/g.81405  ORF Transcript_28158/g.81405 Transcript_28158/m.81405 type:complete len:298 (+) Transcript_28158:142-1035(+)|eukprot:CAMPEP_0181043526 /NCGR_PEP_ID=MMETSP1070-20121207/12762_1 /TAXON_ID=265543 /ORGANISM="Minutocellus polymorphus, Strain NH13" /LENGTH=297 /DNA_ID=CAMNT_0023121875 /DNA_START=93 /DNA_END=986 /DNA_ORIENTATION=-
MPTKTKKKAAAEGKKAAQKKKDKMVQDKTFGLKNKNKSKKVQQQIEGVKKSVYNSGDPKQRKAEEDRKKAKVAAKARKKALKDEQDALFGEALLAVQKSGTTKLKSSVQAKGRDHDADDKKKGTSRAMKMMFQMDAKEMEEKLKEDPNYVPTLEDEIEMQRQKKVEALKASGQKGTPITEKSFKEWQERKRKRHAAEAKKIVEKELKKKKGKGLAILSGRDLFEYKRDLFKDDEEDLANAEIDETAEVGEHGESKEEGAVIAPLPAIVEDVADRVQSELFLEGDDDDLDDLDDLDDD